MGAERRFWESKSLVEMSSEEWESLCDGCGKCCLHKLEDMETGEVVYTNVACRLLDIETIRCKRYSERLRFVADCLVLTPSRIAELSWLPDTCAYRLVAEEKPLPPWHPLITGIADSTISAGASIHGRCIREQEAGDLEDHVSDLQDR